MRVERHDLNFRNVLLVPEKPHLAPGHNGLRGKQNGPASRKHLPPSQAHKLQCKAEKKRGTQRKKLTEREAGIGRGGRASVLLPRARRHTHSNERASVSQQSSSHRDLLNYRDTLGQSHPLPRGKKRPGENEKGTQPLLLPAGWPGVTRPRPERERTKEKKNSQESKDDLTTTLKPKGCRGVETGRDREIPRREIPSLPDLSLPFA